MKGKGEEKLMARKQDGGRPGKANVTPDLVQHPHRTLWQSPRTPQCGVIKCRGTREAARMLRTEGVPAME